MAVTTRVYLVRHGETELNQNTPGYCGWTDIPLNDKGRAQAAAVAERLGNERFAAVLSSDLVRARDTAATIALFTHSPLAIDFRFRELNYGEWEGKPEQTLEREDHDRFVCWKANPNQVPTPGGETLQQVIDRASTALEEYVEAHHGGTLLVVAHKTTVRLLLCWALGLPINEYLRIL